MNIDVHVHVAPAPFLRALARAGYEVDLDPAMSYARVKYGVLSLNLGAEFLDPRALLAKMDGLRVDVAVISIATLLVDFKMGRSDAIDVAKAANLELARFAASDGRRFRWLAHLPLQDIEASIGILEEAMQLGAVGAQIGTHVNGRNLDDDTLRPFLDRAAALGAFLLVHSVDCMASERMQRHYATNLVGNPFESGLAVASSIFGKITERESPIKLCFCHGGGAAPSLAARWDRAWSIDRMAGTHLSKPPSSYFKDLWFDSLCYGSEQLRLLVSVAGADRILLGSDQPFPLAHPDPVKAIGDVDWLVPSEKEAILGKSASALLGI